VVIETDFHHRLRVGNIVERPAEAHLTEAHPHLNDVFKEGVATDFQFSEEVLHTHLAVFGGTRRGKSKLFELIMRQLLDAGRGLAFIDPHSDTADDLLSFLAFHQNDYGFICNRVHYLKPDDRFFSFDPFIYRPESQEKNTRDHYERWFHNKIIDMMKILLRNRGETEAEQAKMTRMRTWLYNGLYAVGVDQGDGKHLPLSDMFVLLNPLHKRHDSTYFSIEPFLPEHILADFEMLRGLGGKNRNPKLIQDFVESTFNQLRQVITPTTERIFSFERPSIDFHQIIQENGIVLASLGKTPTFHQEEGNVLAGLIIREISEAVRTIERAKRKQYFMFIDEAQNFLGEDLQDLLKESAKYKLSCGLAVQSLDNLQQQELDLVPAVLSQCELQITFQQKYFKHAETLAKCLCYPWLDFTELIHEVDRDDGYEWEIVTSVSRSNTNGTSESTGGTTTATSGESSTESSSKSNSYTQSSSDNWSEAIGSSTSGTTNHSVTVSLGNSESHTRSDSQGESQSESRSQGEGTSETGYGDERKLTRSSNKSDGNTHGTTWSQSSAQMNGKNKGEAKSTGESAATGQSQSKSVGGGENIGESSGKSTSNSKGKSTSQSFANSKNSGSNESETRGTSESPTPLHKTRIEKRRTGSLLSSFADQDRMHTSVIQSLPKRHCLVAVGNRSLILRVGEVVDPFASMMLPDDLKEGVVASLKEKIFAREDYYFKAEIPIVDTARFSPRVATDKKVVRDDGGPTFI